MYAHIKGNVEEIYADRVVIEAAGVGYELVCSKMTLKRLCEGKTAKLFVHFHLSQDSVALYGFFDAEERAMFRKLISVSRIGPKVALAVLSVLTPSDVALAVLTDNTAAFDGVAGMGKKTAARVILELKEISVLAANMFSQAEVKRRLLPQGVPQTRRRITECVPKRLQHWLRSVMTVQVRAGQWHPSRIAIALRI